MASNANGEVINNRLKDDDSSSYLSAQKFTTFFVKDILELDDTRTAEVENDCLSGDQVNMNKKSVRTDHQDSSVPNESCDSRKDSSTQKSQDTPSTKSRSPFLDKQRIALEKRFNTSKYISLEERKKLAEELSLTERQVKTWFQNRRTKWRRVRGNEGLWRGCSTEDPKRIRTTILSNVTEKVPFNLVSQLHKELTARDGPVQKN